MKYSIDTDNTDKFVSWIETLNHVVNFPEASGNVPTF